MTTQTGAVLDAIDGLVDDAMAGGETWEYSEAPCPHCGRDWHGLAVTERMEQMRREYQRRVYEAEESGEEIGFAESVIDPDYSYFDDASTVLCPGSTFIGPVPAPPTCGCDVCMDANPAAVFSFRNAITHRVIQVRLVAISPNLAALLGVPAVGHLDDGSVVVQTGPNPFWKIPEDPFDPEPWSDEPTSWASTIGDGQSTDPGPEPAPEPPANPDRFAHLPLLPRPSTRPPMWARRADGRRR